MGAMYCYLKGCTRCSGDLIFDEGYWRCWQCGQYYSKGSNDTNGEGSLEPLEDQPAHAPQVAASNHTTDLTPVDGVSRVGRRRQFGPRSARNINAVIRAKKTSDERWWARNQQIIGYLDQGLSVRETARLVGRGERQIRVIRERLIDLRAEAIDGTQDKK